MREIKFRAFSKVLGYMMPIMTMRELVESDGDTVDYEDLIIMQYTGLKDKNGVEIYEGDILNFGNSSMSMTPSEVKYIERNAGFLIKDRFGDWQWVYDIVDTCVCEVIGNILENSELLK